MARQPHGLAWPQFADRCFVSMDCATDADYSVVVVGHFEGNHVVIDEVMQTQDTRFDHLTIHMKRIPGTEPPRYEPI